MIRHQCAKRERSRVGRVLLTPARAIPTPGIIAVDRERRIKAEATGHEYRPGSTIIGHGRGLSLNRPRTLQARPATSIERPRIFLVE